ncbi:MAG: MtrB/PioB family outer membrane beta-barrel protein, partial [Gammaproteobacteria bacterium]|nr:MtrB/PioB family outer membrane beta-barrel protein [Gammaproteobacteria bacterium]
MMLRDTQRLLILGALITAPAAYGQAVDTSEWACQYCPFEDGYTADYAIGATSVGEDSAYVGDATGYDEEGVYANVDGQGSYARDDYRMRWTLDDLGLDSRALAIEGGQPGTWDYDLAYSELPRRRFATTQSVYVATSDTALTLPSGWVSAPTTAGLTQLGSSLRRTNIESDRALFAIGGRYLPSRRWSVTADYRRRENDGVRLYSGSSFTSSAELPMP